MDNNDIDQFFEEGGLTTSVQRVERPPNVIWGFVVGNHQMMIQTQESANRMRIVAFIAEQDTLDRDELCKLMEANYHSALDARYALTDGNLVSLFLHPFEELTTTQFVLGLYQTIMCAETFGTSYTGGTMTFGAGGDGHAGRAEDGVRDIKQQIVQAIR